MRPIVDIHTHLLPGIDDGPAEISQSVAAYRSLRNIGAETTVLTPHWNPVAWAIDDDLVDIRYSEFVEAVTAYGGTVVRGRECRICDGFATIVADNAYLRLGDTRAVLVEFPFQYFPNYALKEVEELQRRGFQVVVAHAERYEWAADDIRLLRELTEVGAVLQINYSSLGHSNKSRARDTALQLLRNGLVSIAASDSHGIDRRMEAIQPAIKELEDSFATEEVEIFTRLNPQAILEQQPLIPAPVLSKGLSRIFFFGRLADALR